MENSKLRNGRFALNIYVDEIQDDQLVSFVRGKWIK